MVFSVCEGEVTEGFAITHDPVHGPTLRLGNDANSGKSRITIILDPDNPPEIKDGRVYECLVHRKLGADGASRWMLSGCVNVDNKIQVRINTHGPYTKGAGGSWTPVEGYPVTVVRGRGRYEPPASHHEGWNDGIVSFDATPEVDVLQFNQAGGPPYVVFIGQDGRPKVMLWIDYLNYQSTKRAHTRPLTLIHGMMPLFEYVDGQFRPGLDVVPAPEGLGQGVSLATEATSTAAIVPIIGELAVHNGKLLSAALSEVQSGEYAFCFSELTAARIFTFRWAFIKDGHIRVLRERERPIRLAIDTKCGSYLWVLLPGAALVCWQHFELPDVNDISPLLAVEQRDGRLMEIRPSLMLENRDGQPVAIPANRWQLADAAVNPALYVTEWQAPFGHVPDEWAGTDKVVRVLVASDEPDQSKDVSLTVAYEGTLLKVFPSVLILNLAFATGDTEIVEVLRGDWVQIVPEPNKLMDEIARAEQQSLRARAEAMRRELRAIRDVPFATHLSVSLSTRLRQTLSVVECSLTAITTDELRDWMTVAKALMDQLRPALKLARDAYASDIDPPATVNLSTENQSSLTWPAHPSAQPAAVEKVRGIWLGGWRVNSTQSV